MTDTVVEHEATAPERAQGKESLALLPWTLPPQQRPPCAHLPQAQLLPTFGHEHHRDSLQHISLRVAPSSFRDSLGTVHVSPLSSSSSSRQEEPDGTQDGQVEKERLPSLSTIPPNM